jgi:hypothetical protein
LAPTLDRYLFLNDVDVLGLSIVYEVILLLRMASSAAILQTKALEIEPYFTTFYKPF